ncbi:MAG: MerR family transcriptional regulator [Rickettsiales bacterium]|jgi:DNA-binding transcriptional MerR regulator|nr:MerR family transcriptional regulator [Rickettsiales bacterium]
MTEHLIDNTEDDILDLNLEEEEDGKAPGAFRTIGEVAEELGVAQHVLRFWEKKFPQVKPIKRRGRRYYRPDDITFLTRIKSLLHEQGVTIRGAQKFLKTHPTAKIDKDLLDELHTFNTGPASFKKEPILDPSQPRPRILNVPLTPIEMAVDTVIDDLTQIRDHLKDALKDAKSLRVNKTEAADA